LALSISKKKKPRGRYHTTLRGTIRTWKQVNANKEPWLLVVSALLRFGVPEIFNTDQGSQFTDEDFTKPLLDKGVRVSMDGKERWIGECIRRATVAQRQVRGYLLARLRNSKPGAACAIHLFRLLQCESATPKPRLSHSRRNVF